MAKIHPDAELVPAMSKEDYEALKQSLSQAGLMKPIELLDGKVIDGVHRQKACDELGLDADYIDIDIGEMDPLEYVYHSAGPRRHLTKNQKSLLVALLANRIAENKGTSKTLAFEEASQSSGISKPLIFSADQVNIKGSAALKDAVLTGKIPVKQAAHIANLPKSEQTSIIKSGDKKTIQSAATKGKTKTTQKKPTPTTKPDTKGLFKELLQHLKAANRLCMDIQKIKPFAEYDNTRSHIESAHELASNWKTS